MTPKTLNGLRCTITGSNAIESKTPGCGSGLATAITPAYAGVQEHSPLTPNREGRGMPRPYERLYIPYWYLQVSCPQFPIGL